MGGIKLKIHPLFFAFGGYYAITGRIFQFLMITLCAVAHELGHSVVAQSRGYKLDKITLMPFGAVVSGEIEGLKCADQIKIACAGPLVNLAVGVFFVAVWWLAPETYAFTDVVAQTCFSLALVNCIPAYPLDGGRVLHSLISAKWGSAMAEKVCKGVGVAFGGILFALFISTCFYAVNFSLLFFSAFTLFGALGGRKNRYVKMFSDIKENQLKRGVCVKTQAISANTPVKKLFSILDETAINEIRVYDGQNLVATLSQKRINALITRANIYEPIGKYL